jgi:glycogen synthase
MEACHRAFEAYEDDAQIEEMRRAAMAQCFSWSAAAAEYEAQYRRLIDPRATTRLIPRAIRRKRCSDALL